MLFYSAEAGRADLHDVAAPGAEDGLDARAEALQQLVRHEGLDGAAVLYTRTK